MTYQMEYVKNLFSKLGRSEKVNLLTESNLSDREAELLLKRLVKGETIKDCSIYFNLEEDTINKNQLKAIKKLYSFLKEY